MAVTQDRIRLPGDPVLLVIHSLRRGGAEKNIVRLSSFLIKHGYRVTVVTLNGQSGDTYSLDPGIIRESLDQPGAKGMRLFRRIVRLRGMIRSVRPGIIISFLEISNMIALLAARGFEVPVVVSLRNHPNRAPLPLAWRWLRRLLYPSASRIVVVSSDMAKDLARAHPKWRVETINNPVDPRAKMNYARFRSVNSPLLLSIGRMEEQKGFDVLLEACARLREEGISFRLRIVGDGSTRESLIRLASTLKLNTCVEFAPVSKDPGTHYAAADLFVLASRFEGFPNVILEAMAYGVPCISTNCDYGPREIITDGESGWLVPPSDKSALAEVLAQALASPEERQRRVRLASERLSRFDPARISTQWRELIERVLKGEADKW